MIRAFALSRIPRRFLGMRLLASIGLVIVCFNGAVAAELPTRAQVKELSDAATRWLLNQQQDDGSFLPGDQFKLVITTTSPTRCSTCWVLADDPKVLAAAKFIASHIRTDGGIYDPNEGLANYGTALGLKVLVRTGTEPAVITKAQQYLISQQNMDPESLTFGSIGYGTWSEHRRPFEYLDGGRGTGRVRSRSQPREHEGGPPVPDPMPEPLQPQRPAAVGGPGWWQRLLTRSGHGPGQLP